MKESIRQWLRLVRLPNLLTAPGDVLVGFVMAGGFAGGPRPEPRHLVCLALASVLLYAVGVIVNDVFDRDIDGKERPDRPISSGAVSVKAALLAAGVMAAAALTLAVGCHASTGSLMPLAVAAVLLVTIIVYDAPLRHRFPMLGLVLMSSCRALNVLLGASVVPGAILCRDCGLLAMQWPLLGAMAVMFAYVFAFSEVARHEMEGAVEPDPEKKPAFRFALPFMALLWTLIPLMFACFANGSGSISIPTAMAGFAVMISLLNAWMLWQVFPRMVAVPTVIGRHVQNLMRVQGALVMCSAALDPANGGIACLVLGLGIFVGSSVFATLSRRFYAS